MRDACRDRYLARDLRVHRGGRTALGRTVVADDTAAAQPRSPLGDIGRSAHRASASRSHRRLPFRSSSSARAGSHTPAGEANAAPTLSAWRTESWFWRECQPVGYCQLVSAGVRVRFMNSRRNKPVALVTGANKGIGFEVARAIAQSGY